MQGGMRAVEVIVVEVEREEGGAVVTGVVGACISPLAGDGLDEAFGLAVGLGAIGSGKEMADAQLVAGGGEELGTISRAAISEDALDEDAMSLVESDGLVERGQNAGSFFIGKETGKSQAGMIIDGDVKGLDAGAGIAVGAVAGGANAGLVKAAKLFNIKMKEFAGSGAFVAQDRGFGGIEGCEAVEAMALEHAGQRGFGEGKDHKDLSVGTALAAERKDLGFELWRSFAWLVARNGGVIVEARWEACGLGAFEPFADGFFGDAEGGGGSAERGAVSEMMLDQFSSHERSERGISVHSVRAGWLAVESVSTTNLPEPSRADNLLKHDT